MGSVQWALPLRTETRCECLNSELAWLTFFHETPFLLERMAYKIVVVKSWVFGRHFLGNHQSESVTSRQYFKYSLPVIKCELLSKKIEFWKNPIARDSVPVLWDFTDEIGNNMKKCDGCIMKYINIWQMPHNSEILFFPKNKSMTWIKDPFKVQNRPMAFNAAEFEQFIVMVSDSTSQPIFKKQPLVEFGCST